VDPGADGTVSQSANHAKPWQIGQASALAVGGVIGRVTGSVQHSIGGASPLTCPNELVGVDGVVPVLVEVVLELGPRPERGEVARVLARREGRLGDEPRALM